MSFPFGTLSGLYGAAAGFKNSLYDRGFLDPLRLPVPVLSIGNLSMGGTGKTPVTLFLSRQLKEFRRPVIVTRSYGIKRTQPAEVRLGLKDGASVFGDEAMEMAEKAAGVVYSGPKKYETAIFAYNAATPDLILVDDGFQHRALARDFDLVLVDATDDQTELVPAGRLRESFSSLLRADAVLLTKVNLATPQQIARVKALIPSGVPVFEASFNFASISPFFDQSFGRPVALLSALGRNDLFSRQVEERLGRPADKVWAFRDHHAFTSAELNEIRSYLSSNPDALIATTAKDEVKLRAHFKNESRLMVLENEVQIEKFEELKSLILRTFQVRAKWSQVIGEGPWPL